MIEIKLTDARKSRTKLYSEENLNQAKNPEPNHDHNQVYATVFSHH